MITIKDLEKIYRTEEVETVALNKMNLEVNEREFVAIMGPLGCGKSTLLNILGMLDEPDGGSFMFNGTEISNFNENRRSDLRKVNIGFWLEFTNVDNTFLTLIFSISAISMIPTPLTSISNIFCINSECQPLYVKAWLPINRRPQFLQ